MKLKDTIPLMTSADYRERFKAEYWQLKIRTEKLKVMLDKYKAGTLPFVPTCDYEILFEQYVYMKRYLCMLDVRAKIEGITLEE